MKGIYSGSTQGLGTAVKLEDFAIGLAFAGTLILRRQRYLDVTPAHVEYHGASPILASEAH